MIGGCSWRTSSRARFTSLDAIPSMAAGSTAAMRSTQAPGRHPRPPLVVIAEQRRRWGISPIALRGLGWEARHVSYRLVSGDLRYAG